jgi:probable HAF family extracellular repeat protein
MFSIAILAAAGLAPAQDIGNSDRAVARARTYFATAARGRFPITDPATELHVRRVRTSVDGETHIRFDRYYKNVHVFEGEAIAHVKGNQVRVTNALGIPLDMPVTPSITSTAAQATAANARGLTLTAEASVRSSLEILMKGKRSPRTALVWHVTIYSEEANGPAAVESFVDAQSGAIVWSYNNLQTAETTGTGKTMFSGQVSLVLDLQRGTYSMKAPSWYNIQTNDMKNRAVGRGAIFSNTTGTFGNSLRDNSDPTTAGADAHYGTIKTLEYFLSMFNRQSIDGAGSTTYNRVHFRKNYDNAFWNDDCFCMTFGDGAGDDFALISLDVTAHEMAHGVNATEANLTYADESGGLNESSSDIFGTAVETFVNNPDDVPDYWIGERFTKSNWSGSTFTQTSALRYMDDPAKDGTSPACWSSTLGTLDVHYSSGPNNHMFYLLANGGTSKCNGKKVSGIGVDKAARIWYEALTDQLTASSNYHDALAAVLAAATTIYGETSAEHDAVRDAYAAINVGARYEVTDLGTLGGSMSIAYSVNASRVVVGQSQTPSGALHAFLWDGTMHDLGIPLGGTSSGANGINDAGKVIGFSTTPDGSPHAVIWNTLDAAQDLGTLSGGRSSAAGINELGQIVGLGTVSNSNNRAVLWLAPGAPQDLGTLGGQQSVAAAINESGQITGSSGLPGDVNYHAFVWTGGGFEDLGSLGGDTAGGQSINKFGLVAGYSSLAGHSSSEQHPVLWDNGPIDLGSLGGTFGYAWSLNSGTQVVGMSIAKDGQYHAFLYENNVMQDLNNLIVQGSGFLLTQAHYINEVGMIAGVGIINGKTHAFLLTPLD